MNQTKQIPNTVLICYADEQMKTSQQLCITSALVKGGIEKYAAYDPAWIQSDDGFYSRNETILEAQQRGGGYGWWLWKPYICHYMLHHMHSEKTVEGAQYVVYADAGVEFISSIQPIIDAMEKTGQHIFLFGNGHTHALWCKKKVVEAMIPNWFEMPKFAEIEQVQASIIIFRVSQTSVEFTRRWLAWSEIPGFIDDSENVGITKHFRDHRNDQAILTNLAIQANLQVHWWPTQYGHVLKQNYQDHYEQLFFHHRWRELDWVNNNVNINEFMALPKN